MSLVMPESGSKLEFFNYSKYFDSTSLRFFKDRLGSGNKPGIIWLLLIASVNICAMDHSAIVLPLTWI